MNDPQFPGPDPARSRLRSQVSRVDKAMTSLLAGEGGAGAEDLRLAWSDLVNNLSLGPEPTLRNCPKCGNAGIEAATRCSHCWSKLTPPA